VRGGGRWRTPILNGILRTLDVVFYGLYVLLKKRKKSRVSGEESETWDGVSGRYTRGLLDFVPTSLFCLVLTLFGPETRLGTWGYHLINPRFSLSIQSLIIVFFLKTLAGFVSHGKFGVLVPVPGECNVGFPAEYLRAKGGDCLSRPHETHMGNHNLGLGNLLVFAWHPLQ